MPRVLGAGEDWGGGGNPPGPSGGDDRGGGGGGGGRSTGNGAAYADPAIAETGTLQILLSEGTVEGLVDGLKSVYLDGTPIENADGSHNFKGIALALVAGTNTQAGVKGITGTESETGVGVQVVQASPVVRTISSNPNGVRVRIAIPSLKVISSTDGNSRGHSVTVKIERKHATYTSGAWENVTLQGGGTIYGGPFSTKFTRSYRIETPASGAWDIRVTRVSADDADAYHQSQTWWEAYTEIVDAQLRYPNSSVLSLRVNAKQFRSIPQVNVLMKGVKVDVPKNYDPATRAYATTGPGTSGGAWDGTFKEAWTDNPAWTFYAAAVNTRYGAGTFLNASGLDKWTLYSIAQWADAMVDDGHGGTEPRMACNLYIQAQQNAIKALGQLASIFWGVIYYASGLVIPVPDSDDAPVALFTNANVEDGKFVYEGTARQARHTAAIVKFNNPDLAYSSDAAVYEDEAGIARYGYNPLDLQGIGCASQGQALRLAKWAILTELLASETVSFASGLEGSAVKPGDVIEVADQFRADNTRMGGRVVGAATTTVIPLDAPVTLAAGTYTLRCQTATGMESSTVTTGAGTVSSLTVSPALSSAPEEGAGWLLQKNSEASLWRILSVKKGDGLKHDLVALKHDPSKYVALGLSAGDVVPRTPRTNSAPAPSGLVVSSVSRVLNDRQQLSLMADWTLDGAREYIAEASRDLGPWEPMTASGASAYLDGIQPGSWRVRVAGFWRQAGLSPYAGASATVTASATMPAWIATAQTGVNTINDPDTLSLNEKPQIVQDYAVITGEHAKLLSDGATYAPTERAAYVAAYDALVVSYLPTLTSPAAWNSLSGTTALGAGNRVALWNPKWHAVRDTANALRSANVSGAYNLALSNAATDAQNKANLAQLRSQPHKVAWAYASKPALPDPVNYPAGYYAITTDSRTVQVNPAGTAWDDVLVAATGLFGKLFANQVVIGGVGTTLNLDPGFQDNNFWVAMSGSFSIMTESSSPFGNKSLITSAAEIASNDSIPIDTRKSYRVSGWINRESAANGTCFLGLELLDYNGGHINGNGTFHYLGAIGAIPPANTWTKYAGTIGPSGSGCDLTFPVDAKTARMIALLNYGGTTGSIYLSGLSIEEMVPGELIVDGGVKARHLEADMGIVNTIRSTNYTAGTSSAAPVGFKMSGTTFTTAYIGGATATDCQFELGGSANFGGYKVATVNTRVMTGYNRIANGTFFDSLIAWSRTKTYPTVYDTLNIEHIDTPNYSGSGGCAKFFATGARSPLPERGRLSQAFSGPPTDKTVTITMASRFDGGSGAVESLTTVYIVNSDTGATTSVGSFTYTAQNTSWILRNFDVTSVVSGGGQFVLHIEHDVVTSDVNYKLYIDSVNLIW